MFRHVLVPLDGSELAECALPHALEVARAFGARVTVLHVVEQPSNRSVAAAVDPLEWHLIKAESKAYLEGVADRVGDAGVEVTSVCVEGQAADRIIEVARRRDVDLIALSSHGQSGLSGWNISSVVQKTILRAHLSTLLVRAYSCAEPDLGSLQYRRLVVALDCSQRAECVLPFVAGVAGHHQSEVLLAHVVGRPEMPRRAPLSPEELDLVDRVVQGNTSEAMRYLGHLQSRLAGDISNMRPCLVVEANAAAALHELVDREQADLVIMSAHGHTGGTRWPFGSVATSFIAFGNTPLLVVQDLSPQELDRSQAEILVQESKGH